MQDLNGLKRKPKAFVEVKRLDPDAKWLGPRKHQIKNMTDGYMVHATISFTDQKNKKQQDITASVLQELINEDIYDLSDFSKFIDLEARIEYIIHLGILRIRVIFLKVETLFLKQNFQHHLCI